MTHKSSTAHKCSVGVISSEYRSGGFLAKREGKLHCLFKYHSRAVRCASPKLRLPSDQRNLTSSGDPHAPFRETRCCLRAAPSGCKPRLAPPLYEIPIKCPRHPCVHGPDQTRTQIHSRLQQRRRSFGSFGLSCIHVAAGPRADHTSHHERTPLAAALEAAKKS